MHAQSIRAARAATGPLRPALAAGALVAAMLIAMSWGVDPPEGGDAWHGNSGRIAGDAGHRAPARPR